MKVLVTGGAGFIGSHLVSRLLDLGHQVVCIDNFDDYYAPRTKRQNLASALKYTNFRLVEGDILDRPLVKELLSERHDVLIHLAGRAGVRPSLERPDQYAKVNVEGTLNLLDASRSGHVGHFVFGSSSSVYGLSQSVPYREDDRHLQPASPYGASKLAAEVFCETFHRLYDLPLTCLRFFTVYGPRQRPDMAIHRFARLIQEGMPVPMYGDGTTRRDYTYIDDVIDGIVRAMEQPRGYQVYNLAAGEPIALRNLISTMQRALGKEARVSELPVQPGDVPITFASIERAMRHLGYTPRTKVEEGVTRFVEWFRAQHSAAVAQKAGSG